MLHQTVIESDGKMVYITSAVPARPVVRMLWIVLGLLLVGVFLWGPLWLSGFQAKKFVLLWLLLLGVGGYPIWWRIAALILTEEVQLDTRSISFQRTYGFFRGRKKTFPFGVGALATGADILDAEESRLRVSWFREEARMPKPHLLYEHFFSMAPGDYEKAKQYLQELFELADEGEDYELLFSAN